MTWQSPVGGQGDKDCLGGVRTRTVNGLRVGRSPSFGPGYDLPSQQSTAKSDVKHETHGYSRDESCPELIGAAKFVEADLG